MEINIERSLLNDIVQLQSTHLLSHKVLDDRIVGKRKVLAALDISDEEKGDAHKHEYCEKILTQKTEEIHEILERSLLLQKCNLTHTSNTNAYLEFFYVTKLTENLMTENLQHLTCKLKGWLALKPNEFKASDIGLLDHFFRELGKSLDYWRFEVNKVCYQSTSIVPSQRRLPTMADAKDTVWCFALDNFSTTMKNGRKILISKEKRMKLIDTSSNEFWLVQIEGEKHVQVPPAIVLIPPPCEEAIAAGKKIKLLFYDFLSQFFKWSCKVIFWTVILSINKSNENQLSYLNNLTKVEAEKFLEFVEQFKSLFYWCWSKHTGYQLASEKLEHLQDLIKRQNYGIQNSREIQVLGHQPHHLFCNLAAISGTVSSCEKLYELWSTMGIQEEIVSSKYHLLTFKNLSDLKVISHDELSRLWRITVQDDLASENWSDPYIIVENTSFVSDSENLKRSSREEHAEFAITGIFDSVLGDYVNIKDAVRKGIVDDDITVFKDRKAKTEISIHEALMKQYIKVEPIAEKIVRDEEKSYGVITIRTKKESRPYKIIDVWDHGKNQWIDAQLASEKGLLNLSQGWYFSNKKLSLAEAVELGRIRIDYFGDIDESIGNTEEIIQCFAVVGVVNQKTKTVLSFQEALEMNIIDAQNGEYTNNHSGEKMGASEAIKCGFLKVTLFKNPQRLDEDPEKREVKRNLGKLKSAINTIAHLKKYGSMNNT